MSEVSKCEMCGEPMPSGEEMFKFHGYSGPCPKKPLLQPYQSRVVEEKRELDEKIDKLVKFHGSEAFIGLSSDERDRLTRQSDIMRSYSAILSERISAFK